MARVHAEEGHFFDTAGQSRQTREPWRPLQSAGNDAFERKKFDRAIAFYNAALAANPELETVAKICEKRGDAYAEKGDQQKARADYDRALRFAPKPADDHMWRASIFEKKENYRAANDEVENALRLSPKDSSILNGVAWFKATSPGTGVRNGKVPIRLAKEGGDLTSFRQYSLMDTLAAAYAEAGDFEQALKFQTQALSFRFMTRQMREDLEGRLALYRQRKPCRQKAAATAPTR